MTIGSTNLGVYTSVNMGINGTSLTRSWNGADTPRSPKQNLQTYSTVREVHRKDGSSYLKEIVQRYPIDWYLVEAERAARKARMKDNPYTTSNKINRSSSSQLVSYLSNGQWSHTGALSDQSVSLSSAAHGFTADEQIALVGKLREKLHGTDFNMSVALGEGRQSLALIADSAVRIAKAGYHAKRGDISGAARSLLEGTSRSPLKKRHKWDPWKKDTPLYPNLRSDSKNTSSIWLELQYGWLPLFNDVVAGAGQLSHILEVPARQSYRVHIYRHTVSNFVRAFDLVQYGTSQSVTMFNRDRWLLARIEEKDLPSYARILGLTNPELVAWELVPFSFVVDWFLPIGQYLEARATASSLRGTFVTSTKYTRIWHPESLFHTSGTKGNHWRSPPNVQSDVFKEVNFKREVTSSLNVPMPTMKRLNQIVSWKHCANALALVTQVFSRNGTSLTPKSKSLMKASNRLPESYWQL